VLLSYILNISLSCTSLMTTELLGLQYVPLHPERKILST
jgi:hypothetical protein